MDNNQNGFSGNQQPSLNVIPQNQPENNINQEIISLQNNNIIYNQDNINNQNNGFFNNNINTNLDNNFNNSINNTSTRDSLIDNDEMIAFKENNKFIMENQTNTALNDLNVEGEYNGLPKMDYSQDPKVIANIESSKKKNTITITGEAKIFLIIIAVLLLFTFVMPIIFDYVRDIQY